LAGHLGVGLLLDAIGRCWAHDASRADYLEDYLWAAARCGGDDPDRLLESMCTIWAAQSEQPPQPGRTSPREKVGLRSLSSAFRERLPERVVRFFVRRGRRK